MINKNKNKKVLIPKNPIKITINNQIKYKY